MKPRRSRRRRGKGYDANFLDFGVPLPKLSKDLHKAVQPLIEDAKPSGSDGELVVPAFLGRHAREAPTGVMAVLDGLQSGCGTTLAPALLLSLSLSGSGSAVRPGMRCRRAGKSRPASMHRGRFCNPPEFQSMAEMLEIQFASLSAAPVGTLVLLAGEELALGGAARAIDERSKGAIKKAAAAAGFTGKAKTSIEILAPAGHRRAAPHPAGHGQGAGKELDRLLLGGYAFAQISARKGEAATHRRRPRRSGRGGAEAFAADLALGALLRSYTFKKYRTQARPRRAPRTRRRDGLTQARRSSAPSPDAAAKAFRARKALAEGVFLARDLVNEPANMLGPVEFADRMRDLAGSRPRGRGAGRGAARRP